MPTYEYKCPKCKKVIEVIQSINCEWGVLCADCKIEMTKGFGGGTGLHFKGSGFYETDYKGK